MRKRTEYCFASCLRSFVQCILWTGDIAIALVGPLLSITATVLILFVTYVYFDEIYPALLRRYGTFRANLTTLLGLFLLLNLLFNYFMTKYVGPGSPPKTLNAETISLLIDDPECPRGAPHRYCRMCAAVKPMRTHHCSICKKCVLKMDHHCPWVNTCVGWRNHKHFLLFLFYMWTGSLFFLIVTFDRTFIALTGGISGAGFLVSAVLCFAASIASFFFLVWNVYLLCTNQSTIEFYGNACGSPKRRNPYHLGTTRNIREVFGLNRSLWTILLPSRTPPAGDGLVFEMCDKDVLIRTYTLV